MTGRPVLQLPIGRDGIAPGAHAVAMYRSIGRWYPLVNGYASYWPKGFQRRMWIAQHLPDPKATAELVRSTGLGLIWVDLAQLPWADVRRWRRVTTGDGWDSCGWPSTTRACCTSSLSAPLTSSVSDDEVRDAIAALDLGVEPGAEEAVCPCLRRPDRGLQRGVSRDEPQNRAVAAPRSADGRRSAAASSRVGVR